MRVAETPEQGEPQAEEPAAPATPSARPSLKRRITRPTFMVELTAGSPVGEYELQEQIGEGAMGTVYSAIHPLIGKRAAVKILKPEMCANQMTIDRFVQEAQAVNQIGHPNIVDVFSFGELPDGRVYLVMEYLRGEDLRARVARGPIAVHEACDILDGIARALEAAHAKSIIHRDLKPENVFLHNVDNGPLMVKLVDFGIAKLKRSNVPKEKTQTGNMLGTPRYISPEQARGIDVDHRTDIYSLGVIAYEMLGGKPPFDGETAMDIVVAHLNDLPAPLANYAKVPRPLEQTIMAMLSKDPAQRPNLADIRGTLVDPQRRLTPLPSSMHAVQPPGRRAPWIALAAVGVVAIGLLTWKVVANSGGDPAPQVVVVQPPPPPVVVEKAVAPTPPPPTPPPPVEPARSKLVIDIDGATNAEIKVDGERWAKGSSATGETSAGKHEIEVIAGNDTVRQQVDVAPGESNNVKIVVKRVGPAAHPSRPVAHPAKATPPPPPRTNDDDLIIRPKH